MGSLVPSSSRGDSDTITQNYGETLVAQGQSRVTLNPVTEDPIPVPTDRTRIGQSLTQVVVSVPSDAQDLSNVVDCWLGRATHVGLS